MKYNTEDLEKASEEIKNKANPVYALLGAIIGALPAITLFLLFGEMGGAIYIMLALPPLLIGYAARFIGRTYLVKHRVSVGLVSVAIHILGCYLVQFSPIIYLLALVAFAISFTTARVKLEPIQKYALASVNLGKIGCAR